MFRSGDGARAPERFVTVSAEEELCAVSWHAYAGQACSRGGEAAMATCGIYGILFRTINVYVRAKAGYTEEGRVPVSLFERHLLRTLAKKLI